MSSEPKPLPAPTEFVIDYARKMQVALVEASFWKCCLNCEHWSNNSPERQGQPESLMCHKWNAVPPPSVIVYSCDNWICIVPF